ncbi:MAG: PD40 domain-containing protein [Saprospiraceae bacterium]|nr:PD40 domain-containing protein [Saprospiraceae bacterium]MCB0625311.1 PD40 domain-containing protein [Saprospiraceae bacterium]MCB0680341.1 PD40 domain-containing protein [Saprospiraceae bacterium]
MDLKTACLLLGCLWGFGALYAQPESLLLKSSADELFRAGNYAGALSEYQVYYADATGDLDARYKIGVCHYELNDLEEAGRWLGALVAKGEPSEARVYYYLGRIAHDRLDFAKAAALYKTYLRQTPRSQEDRQMVKDAILRCGFGMQMAGRRSGLIVENLGTAVNSRAQDFRPIPSPNYEDRLYFSSNRPEALGGRQNDQGQDDPRLGRYRSDMYAISFAGGRWGGLEPMSYLLNTPREEVILDFSENGRQLYYFRGYTRYGGQVLVDSFRPDVKERTLFSKPFQSSFQPENGDTDPFFFRDTILLFASRREGGFGGLDLYITIFRQGRWTEPANLGPAINSAYDDRAPFLARDGRTLYFSSNAPDRSLGGLDILRAVYADTREVWSKPENLGIPVNSAADDLHFRLTRSGSKAFFSSDRKDGQGGLDLYGIYFREVREEQSTLSVPIVFQEVPSYKRQKQRSGGVALGQYDPGQHFPESMISSYALDPLYYDPQGEVVLPRNLPSLQLMVRLMQEYPDLKLVLTCHSDGSDPAQYDLFFGMRRAEAVAVYLQDHGIPTDRVRLRAVGSAYPVASPPNGRSYPALDQLNRRIDLQFLNLEGLPLRIRIKAPETGGLQLSEAYSFYRNMVTGLSYKVEVAISPQMYQGEPLTRYPHPMIEKQPEEGVYRYTVGLYQTYLSASQLKADLQQNGVAEAVVVPYIQGMRLSTAEARAYSEAFPDLKQYLAE